MRKLYQEVARQAWLAMLECQRMGDAAGRLWYRRRFRRFVAKAKAVS